MIIMVIICIALGAFLAYIVNHSNSTVRALQRELQELRTQHELDRVKIKKDSTFRSSAVNWGKTIEHFVPFMSKFPVPPEDVVFLGMPIDYVGFTDTESATDCKVHFIEVKSGNAFLMSKQKNIKKAIQQGRVQWHEIAVESNKVEDK